MSAHKKLMEARLLLQASELKKSGHNKFAGYDYFELGDFLPTVQKIFAGLKLCGVVSYTADVATLTITDIEDGTVITITSPMGSAALKGCHEVQNIGAVETYQRRYLWVTAMEIVEHDALDATTGSEKTEKKSNTAQAVMKDAFDEQPKEIQELMAANANTVRDYLDNGNVTAAYDRYAEFRDSLDDASHQAAFRSLFSASEKSALKKEGEARK